MSSGWMWLFLTVGGAAILGAALFFGQQTSNIFRRSPRTVQRQEEGTKRLYREEARRETDV